MIKFKEKHDAKEDDEFSYEEAYERLEKLMTRTENIKQNID
jgi:hypothetical protein